MRSRLTSSFGFEERLQVGQQIADLAPVEEALAANQVITDRALAQRGLRGRDCALVRKRMA